MGFFGATQIIFLYLFYKTQTLTHKILQIIIKRGPQRARGSLKEAR